MEISNKNMHSDIVKYFELILTFNSYLFSLYSDTENDMVSERIFREKKTPVYGPDERTIDKIREEFINLIFSLDLKMPEMANKYEMVHSRRYRDIMPENDVRECFKSVLNVHKQMEMLKSYILKDSGNNYIYLSGPLYPFVYGQSVHANMIFIATYDIFMIDWDVKLGITKITAIEILERFLESQGDMPERERLFKSTPCFKIYETDNGVHGFLISHLVPHDSDVSSKIMIENCSDINYAAMTRFKGFSIRLSSKIFNDKKYTDSEYIKTQYIQKEGVNIGKNKRQDDAERIIYVGDQSNINPYIEEFVDIIYKTQRYIMSYDTNIIYDTLYNRNKAIINDWGDYLANQYNTMKNRNNRSEKNAKLWAKNSDNHDRLNAIQV